MRDDSFVVETFVAMLEKKMLQKIMETINGLKKVFNFSLHFQTNGRKKQEGIFEVELELYKINKSFAIFLRVCLKFQTI